VKRFLLSVLARTALRFFTRANYPLFIILTLLKQ